MNEMMRRLTLQARLLPSESPVPIGESVGAGESVGIVSESSGVGGDVAGVPEGVSAGDCVVFSCSWVFCSEGAGEGVSGDVEDGIVGGVPLIDEDYLVARMPAVHLAR